MAPLKEAAKKRGRSAKQHKSQCKAECEEKAREQDMLGLPRDPRAKSCAEVPEM